MTHVPIAVELDELERASYDRIVLLLGEHTPAATLAAHWELESLAERTDLARRWPR